MSKERILITVKTYPTLSRKHGETVCTAGVREDGSWVRIYPVPFRRLDETEQYKKFDWIECDLVRSRNDVRPETRHPHSFSYRFKDDESKATEMQVLDWETGALFWNCLRKAGGDETKALESVRAKYLDRFSRLALHFFLGTTQQFHFVAPNPWVIVGVLPIPPEHQPELF